MIEGIYSFTVLFSTYDLYVVRQSMIDLLCLTFGIKDRLFLCLNALLLFTEVNFWTFLQYLNILGKNQVVSICYNFVHIIKKYPVIHINFIN